MKSTYQASNGNPSALFLVPRENLYFGLAYFVAFVVNFHSRISVLSSTNYHLNVMVFSHNSSSAYF